MKNYKNINEETKRIKSLFTEERLYGNLVGKETKILNEQFRRILKLFGDKFQYVDSLKKQFKLLGSFQEGLFDQYVKILKSGKQVDLLATTKGKYIFELLPEKVRYDALLDYVDSIDDVAEQKEILTKISKYFDDNPSIKPKNMDEFESMFKKLGKSIDDINLDDFVRDVSKKIDNLPSKTGSLNVEDLIKEFGFLRSELKRLENIIISNKSAEEIVEESGLFSAIGGEGVKKVTNFLKKQIMKPVEFVNNYFIPLVPKMGKDPDFMQRSLQFSGRYGLTLPITWNLFRNGEIGWFSGWATIADDLGLNTEEFIKSVYDFFGKDICNALSKLSKDKLNCERIGTLLSEKVQEVMSLIKEKDFKLICNTLEKFPKNEDAFLDLLKNENIKDVLLKTLKDEIDNPKYGIKDDAIAKTIGFLTNNITPLIDNSVKYIYVGNQSVRNKIDNVFKEYRELCDYPEKEKPLEFSTDEKEETKPKRKKYTF